MLHLQFFSPNRKPHCMEDSAEWLPSLHWASGAVQVLARGGFCLPFMGVPVVVPAFGLRLDGHGGLLLDGHGGVRPWHRGAWVDTPKQGQLAVRVEVRLAYMCWQTTWEEQACWQAGHETGSAVGACPGMPSVAKGRPGLSAPQAVDGEVVSRVRQTEARRFPPGLRWHQPAESGDSLQDSVGTMNWLQSRNGMGPGSPSCWLGSTVLVFGAWLVAKTKEAVVGTSSLAAVWSWTKLADSDL